MRPLLKPLVPFYAAGLGWKNSRFDRGAATIQRLKKPVISVGSLSAGGAGKTPFVLALLELLQENNISADVLSRGYGRTLDDAIKVNPKGDLEDFGDEAIMIARQGWPVYVAPQRYDAGLLAEEHGKAEVHVLDDGMQHRQLHRDIDIALLTREDANDLLLPAGNLREPMENLRRAHVVVLREEETSGLQLAAHHYAPMAKRWKIRRTLQLEGPLPERAFAFCGIARPSAFYAGLKSIGVPVVGTRSFRDHHAYSSDDVALLTELAEQAHSDAVITTEKDVVKITASLPNLRVARLRVSFTEPDLVWDDLRQMLP